MPAWGRGSTRASRRTRATVLRRSPTCYLHYDGCTAVATEDDHIMPLFEGGSDTNPANHAGACHHCHDIKSRAEAARARAQQQAKARHPHERHPGSH